ISQRSAPQYLAVAREGGQLITGSENVDVAGSGIAGRRRPGDAAGRHRAFINIQAAFPHDLSRVGIQTHNAFLHRLSGACGIEQEDAPAHDDWRRASSIWSFPQKVLAGWRPFAWQSRLMRDAVAPWTSPIRPIAS